MATTKNEIRQWIKNAPEGTTHMLVVVDTFSYEDYPVYIPKGKDVQKVITEKSGNMQKVMEVYNLQKDTETQLESNRVWNI